MTQLNPEVQHEVLSGLQLAVRDAYCKRRRNVMFRFTQHRAQMKRRSEAKLKYEALASLASAVAQAKADEQARNMEIISQMAAVFKEFDKKPKVKKDDTEFFAFRSVTKTKRLPEEDPVEFSPHGIDLSEVEVSDGGYYFEHPENDPHEYDPYRGGDWYQRAVYGDNSLVGRGPDRYYSVLLASAFAQSMSIGLGRKVWVNPKALPQRPNPEDLLRAWSRSIGSNNSSPVREKRSMWMIPLMAWIEVLSRHDAGMYLMACRKEYAMVRRMKCPPTGLLRCLEFAGKQLRDRTLDFEEVM